MSAAMPRLRPGATTAYGDDAMPSAQFEHTVVVHETGAEILTVAGDGWSATSRG
ncbi:MAG: hypothetical protein ACE367_15315 [Acidimicrobiales bacterium]